MTQARTIRALAAVEFRVPDPTATAAFLEDALDLRRGQDGPSGIDLTSDGAYGLPVPDRLLSAERGEALELSTLVFVVPDEPALDLVGERVDAAGGEVTRFERDDRAEAGLAFTDLNGIRVKCRLPTAGNDAALPHSPVRPRRLGHVNMKVPSPPETAAFYASTLGLKLTEQIGERLFFLRVGSDHHNLALRPANNGSANIHHVALEAGGWDQLRVICDHMAARGHRIEYGPGRHAPGHQLFIYLTDPASGLRVEVFADMAHVDDDSFVPIRRGIDRMRSVNVWGPEPPASFLE